MLSSAFILALLVNSFIVSDVTVDVAALVSVHDYVEECTTVIVSV